MEKMIPFVSNYLQSPNHEIEFRLGKIASGKFDTNVGLETYSRVLRRLERYEGWESKKISNDTIYYGKNGRRATCNEDTDEIVRIVKKSVNKLDYTIPNSPFDVRVGIATEIPYEPEEDEEVFEEIRTRVRHSFVRKNLVIDVSMVRFTPDDLDAESDTTYQIELEIIDPSLVKKETTLFNIIHKINDVLKITGD
jgi:hypothetical protein